MALYSLLVFKLPDFTKYSVPEPNASDVAAGAVLLKQYDDKLHPVAYFSDKYIHAVKTYSSHNKELLAIFKACQKWRCYLDRHHATIFSDHIPLINLRT